MGVLTPKAGRAAFRMDERRTPAEACSGVNALVPGPASVLVYFLYLMGFEFDPAKSAANLKKHGIDFLDAQALWNDVDRLEIPARSLDEP
ncbi:MAG TPA: BrnT family toxin, partial [Pseudolabrys sp.]|nr:BrnT family toxin [Pseudolabrys sp.]